MPREQLIAQWGDLRQRNLLKGTPDRPAPPCSHPCRQPQVSLLICGDARRWWLHRYNLDRDPESHWRIRAASMWWARRIINSRDGTRQQGTRLRQ